MQTEWLKQQKWSQKKSPENTDSFTQRSQSMVWSNMRKEQHITVAQTNTK